MKKLLVLALVLSMATIANAALVIDAPATVNQGESITISLNAGTDVYEQGGFYLGISTTSVGGATIDIGSIIFNYLGNSNNAIVIDDPDTSDSLGLVNPFTVITLADVPTPGQSSPPVTGLLVSSITFTGVSLGMVDLVVLSGADGSQMGAGQIEVVTPEPVTVGLLGLGAMFLRRRK